MTHEETLEHIADEIRTLLNTYIGTNPAKKANEASCESLRSNVLGYLEELRLVGNMYKVPTVKVENEGPFVTINFFDKDDNRLETLPDMLEYMGKPN
jgi:hypothetical protein